MNSPQTPKSSQGVELLQGEELEQQWGVLHTPKSHPAHDLRWLRVLRDGLGHTPYCIVAKDGVGKVTGYLPLCYVHSMLFGKYLVSLPYISSSGIVCDDDSIAASMIERAVELADSLRVKHLELRHESEFAHKQLPDSYDNKVHMRLSLPGDIEALWSSFKPKVRNQVRKGEKQEFTVDWGGAEFIDEFHSVFARNMRDLGTPVFGHKLFHAIANHFGDQAEYCVVRHDGKPAAVALLVHGTEVTEVPSASALKEHNPRNVNMFMYWQLLKRAVDRKQTTFDFGRCSKESPTHRFKKQWGAEMSPAVWQYHLRRGNIEDMRRESGNYGMAIRVWQKLPLAITKLIGPTIVRGIP